MKKLLLRLALFLPIPAIVVATNVWIDPGNLRDEGTFETEAAEILLSGRNVGDLGNCNERLLMKKLVEGQRRKPDVLVLGSSRAMQISRHCFEGRAFLNAAISGAQVEDFLAIYRLAELQGFAPRTVVITLDGSLLNPGDEREQWHSLLEEQRQMEARLGFEEGTRFAFLGEYRRDLELASPVYFQQSLRALFLHDGGRREIAPAAREEGEAQLRLADGSLVYGADVRDRGVEQVNREAMHFATQAHALYGLDRFSAIDAPRLEKLDRFVGYLRRRGVEVRLFVPPYHPLVYRIISTRPEYANVLVSERLFRELAARHRVAIAGSFDPGPVGVGPEDFHDGMHPKRAAVERIFGCRGL